MEPSWNGRPAIGLIESLKIRGMTYCFAFFRVGQLEIKLPLRKPLVSNRHPGN
jgi:hypothetical protein